MKYFLTSLILTLVFQYIQGQDIITTKDKKQHNVKVIEKTDKLVRYKMSDYEDGPLLMLKTNRIARIEYKNGYTDLLGNQNPRKDKPLGISAGIGAELTGGGGIFSTNIDYFVIPQIDLEMNVGTSDLSGGMYFSAGSRFHLDSNSSEKRLSPFTGILLGSYYGEGMIQVPAGVNYVTKAGLNASLSINEMIILNSWQATFVELRVGWRFKL